MRSVKAPYLLIDHGFMVPEQSLRVQCSAYSLVKEYGKNATLIDSNGTVFQVEKAKKVGRPIHFWWSNWLYATFWNPKITAELVLKKGFSKISLRVLKTKVLFYEKRHLSFVHPDYAKEFRSKIMKMSSAQKIIEFLYEEYFLTYPSNDPFAGYGFVGAVTLFFTLMFVVAIIGSGGLPRNTIDVFFVIGSPVLAVLFGWMAVRRKMEKTSRGSPRWGAQ